MYKLAAALCTLAIALAWPSPSRAMTLEEERKTGRKVFKEVLRTFRLVKDPDAVEYLRNLGARLAALDRKTPFKYKFYLINRPDMNAFAIPGGYIFMFRGMLEALDNEAQLVSILAHEMGHIHHRHLARRSIKTRGIQLGTLAGMLAGVLLGVAGAGKAGQALMMGSMAGGAQAFLAYSREDEREADYTGYMLMTKLGYPPRAMVKTFKKLMREQRYAIGDIPSYLSTHPASETRADSIEALSQQFPRPVKSYDNSQFLRIKTRLMALYGDPETLKPYFYRKIKANPLDPLPWYGLCLAAIRTDDYKLAKKVLAQLQKLWPKSPYVYRAWGKAEMGSGNFAKAVGYMNRVLISRPEDKTALMVLGRAYYKQGNYEQAKSAFTRVLVFHNDDAEARMELGRTLGSMGQTGLAAFNLGLAFKAMHRHQAAVFHLRRAKKALAENPAMVKRINKALAQLSKDAKQRALERLKRQRQEEEKRRRQQDEDERQRRRDGYGMPRRY